MRRWSCFPGACWKATPGSGDDRPGPPAGSSLGRCFEVFTVSAFGLETLRAYAAPGEEDRVRAFRRGLPLPERPARTSRWLRRIAATTATGKTWHRVRVLDRPL